MAVVESSIYTEFVDFITSTPTLEEISEFRLSDATEQRISDLLEANRAGTLNAEQQAELDEAVRLEHIMRMMKIRAFEKLDKK